MSDLLQILEAVGRGQPPRGPGHHQASHPRARVPLLSALAGDPLADSAALTAALDRLFAVMEF